MRNTGRHSNEIAQTDSTATLVTKAAPGLYSRRATVRQLKGIAVVLMASLLWAVSSNMAEVLLAKDHFTAGWLVAVRMLVSGLLLLLMVSSAYGRAHTLAVWRQRRTALRLVVLSIAGLLGMQYSFFSSIAYGNSVVATLLQNLGPVFITLYVAWRLRQKPSSWQFGAVSLAVMGTFLLVTGGHLHSLSVPRAAVIWGLLSGVTMAFYTLYPGSLLRAYGPATIVGWAMLLGGIVLSGIVRPWQLAIHPTPAAWFLVACVIVLGTLLAYYLYIASLKYISPSETSLLASSEPLFITIIAALYLHIELSLTSLVGGACILVTVVILSLKRV